MTLTHWCFLALVVTVSGQPPAGQTPPAGQKPPQEAQKPQAAIKAEDLPVDLDRIQRALANTPRLRFDEKDQPVFRVQVFGEKPTIDDILGPDWATGPVKYGSMTHQEFVAFVTPRDLQGYGGLTNTEGATIAATSFALQWTLQKAIRKYRDTQDAREREAARKEVIEALNALEQARAKAGK